MQYMLLIYEKSGWQAAMSDDERQTLGREYYSITNDPRVTPGRWMKPAEFATTVRIREGEPLITDGPFADTKEVFGGYLVYTADNLDQAIEMASRIPQARLGGAVEIRPLVEQQS
ncbi:MAG: hypothetical protein JOZ81_25615 [Chloroflexi bacterium]|nr:hypothetical protein [Chloroflexota bacterium]MBV9546393.1 hypothetical protein [Chloroflexota bacterium]